MAGNGAEFYDLWKSFKRGDVIEALDTLLLSVAPVLPFLAEEVHEHRGAQRPPPPVERVWEDLPASWTDFDLARRAMADAKNRAESLLYSAERAISESDASADCTRDRKSVV